jgi:hypothetical protein
MQWFIDNRPDFRESLQKFHYFLRDSFKVPFPTTAGPMMHLGDVAAEISRRLSRLFLRDADGRRPVFGGAAMFPDRPALARPAPVLRVLPRRQRRRHQRLAPDGLDGPGGQAPPAERRMTMLPGRQASASRDNLSRNGRAGT